MKLLFVCTHNRCRSILAEAITRQRAQGRIDAFSAGSQPAGAVHPLTEQFLAERGYGTIGLRSKSLQEVADLEPDAVVTVCDSAAAEACPIWLGDAARAHWSLPDPSRLDAPEDELRRAFFEVIDRLEGRVDALLERDFDSLNRTALQRVLQSVAERP